MRPTLLFPIMLLGILAIVPAYAQTVVPLEWSDSYKELKPGYSITISLHAEGNGIVGLADAGFKLQSSNGVEWLFGITQQGRDVIIVMEGAGAVAKLDTLWPWKISRHTYEDTMYVKLYCPGEAPPGETPQDGYLWVEVRDSYTNTVRHYLAKDPGPGQVALKIFWFSESGGGMKSEVVLGEPVKYSDCGDDYAGDLPGGGESNSGGEYQGPPLDVNKVAMIGLGIVALLGFLAIVKR